MSFFDNLFHSTGFSLTACKERTVGTHSDRNDPRFYDWNSSPSQPFELLEHNRMYYIQEGTASVITHKETVSLEQGYVYLFPANSIVATRCADMMRHSYIHFTMTTPFNYFNIINMHRRYRADLRTDRLFADLIRLSLSQNPMDKVLQQAYFLELLAPFFDGAELVNQNVLRFFAVLCYIDSHLDKDISVLQLANIMNLDTVYFSNLFCSTFKIPPIQYIQNKKMDLAQNLLLNSMMSIREIALKCGFEDSDYFSRIFKKKMNMSPRQFRGKYILPDPISHTDQS